MRMQQEFEETLAESIVWERKIAPTLRSAKSSDFLEALLYEPLVLRSLIRCQFASQRLRPELEECMQRQPQNFKSIVLLLQNATSMLQGIASPHQYVLACFRKNKDEVDRERAVVTTCACAKGHVMDVFTTWPSEYSGLGAYCDLCGRSISVKQNGDPDVSQYFFHCTLCGYDVCPSCGPQLSPEARSTQALGPQPDSLARSIVTNDSTQICGVPAQFDGVVGTLYIRLTSDDSNQLDGLQLGSFKMREHEGTLERMTVIQGPFSNRSYICAHQNLTYRAVVQARTSPL
jgi:hypothetical protein